MSNASSADGIARALYNVDQDQVGIDNSVTVDSSIDQTLQVTFQHNPAHANISARCLAVHLEKV